MAVNPQTRIQIVDLIEHEADFERGSIAGRKVVPSSVLTQGMLNHELYIKLIHDVVNGGVRYIVSSFQTPIAWVTSEGEVVIPTRVYSGTTSQHQKMVREAFPNGAEPARSSKPAYAASNQAQPVEEELPKRTSRQYEELAEDDLIALLDELADQIEYGHEDFLASRLTTMLAVTRALKARRDATAEHRARIGEPSA